MIQLCQATRERWRLHAAVKTHRRQRCSHSCRVACTSNSSLRCCASPSNEGIASHSALEVEVI